MIGSLPRDDTSHRRLSCLCKEIAAFFALLLCCGICTSYYGSLSTPAELQMSQMSLLSINVSKYVASGIQRSCSLFSLAVLHCIHAELCSTPLRLQDRTTRF